MEEVHHVDHDLYGCEREDDRSRDGRAMERPVDDEPEGNGRQNDCHHEAGEIAPQRQVNVTVSVAMPTVTVVPIVSVPAVIAATLCTLSVTRSAITVHARTIGICRSFPPHSHGSTPIK